MPANIIELWLELLELADNATLEHVAALYHARPQTPQCPTVALFGQQTSDEFYTHAPVRPALDAWDTGRVTAYDIVRWVRHILKERQDANGRAG